jgi:DNA-binding MarR family transcriptional regulator
MSKANDPRIVLHALFDSTREMIQKAVKLELAQYHISQPQVKVMHMLAQSDGGLTLNQLSDQAVRELNSVTTLVSRMQTKGLVRKVKRPGNSKTYVTLTDKGTDIYDNTVTERAICLIFDALSDEEKKQLTSLLSKLQIKARALLGLDYKPPFLQQD